MNSWCGQGNGFGNGNGSRNTYNTQTAASPGIPPPGGGSVHHSNDYWKGNKEANNGASGSPATFSTHHQFYQGNHYYHPPVAGNRCNGPAAGNIPMISTSGSGGQAWPMNSTMYYPPNANANFLANYPGWTAPAPVNVHRPTAPLPPPSASHYGYQLPVPYLAPRPPPPQPVSQLGWLPSTTSDFKPLAIKKLAVSSSEEKKPAGSSKVLIGKRRGGGRSLPTGVIKRTAFGTENPQQMQSKEDKPWSRYMAEVERYKNQTCSDDAPTRSLVK